jgi:hypothetical protein
MDSSLTLPNSLVNQSNSAFRATSLGGDTPGKNSADGLIIQQLAVSTAADAAEVNLTVSDLYKGLSVSVREILAQLNKMLEGKLPNGIEGIKPEDATPERTADTIVRGIAAMFDGYSKSNPELDPEELVSRFFASARRGVEAGYSSAFSTLQDLGAFGFEGVQSGVEETKSLIEEKLKSFEAAKRREYGLTIDLPDQEVTDSVSEAVLTQAGGALLYGQSAISIAA